jgi:hypothetical protein
MIRGSMAKASLRDEIAAYEAMRPDLESASLGKWALVHNRALVRLFDQFEEAAAEAVRQFGRGPYLIRQIGSSTGALPASVMFRPLNGPNAVRLP